MKRFTLNITSPNGRDADLRTILRAVTDVDDERQLPRELRFTLVNGERVTITRAELIALMNSGVLLDRVVSSRER